MKTLKTLAAVVIAALTLSLTSCGKDAEDLIIGSWEMISATYTMTTSGLTGDYAQYNGTQTETETPAAGESTVMTFQKDGTYTNVNTDEDGTYTTSGTYTVKDDKLTMTMTEGNQTETMTFNIDNIDKKNMVISYSETGTEEVVPGMTATMSVTIKINLTKK